MSIKKYAGLALIVALALTGCASQTGQQTQSSPVEQQQSGASAASTSSSPWSQKEQQQAIAVSAGVLGGFYGGFKDVEAWRKHLAVSGTERFKQDLKGLDPYMRPEASVIDVYSTDFTNEQEAKIRFVSSYDDGQNNAAPVWVLTVKKADNGKMLVDHIEHEARTDVRIR